MSVGGETVEQGQDRELKPVVLRNPLQLAPDADPRSISYLRLEMGFTCAAKHSVRPSASHSSGRRCSWRLPSETAR